MEETRDKGHEEARTPEPTAHQSPEIGELASALAAAQRAFETPRHNRTVEVETRAGYRYTFDYADLGELINVTRAPLAENGLTLTHGMRLVGGKFFVVTTLAHRSGQWIASFFPVNAGLDMKELGGQITYAKRYLMSAVLNLFADQDKDADPVAKNSGKAKAEKGNAGEGPGPEAKVIAPAGKTKTETKNAQPAPDPKTKVIAPAGKAAEAASAVSAKPKAGAAAPPKEEKAPTPGQRLAGAMKKNEWTAPALQAYMKGRFGVAKREELRPDQYEDLIRTVETRKLVDAVADLELDQSMRDGTAEEPGFEEYAPGIDPREVK